jgi:hypothetical protein
MEILADVRQESNDVRALVAEGVLIVSGYDGPEVFIVASSLERALAAQRALTRAKTPRTRRRRRVGVTPTEGMAPPMAGRTD